MAAPPAPLRLLGALGSGNAQKARMVLSMLNVPWDFVPVDLGDRDKSTRTRAFRLLNPAGQVPVLVDPNAPLDDTSKAVWADEEVLKRYGPPGLIVRDSAAILTYVSLTYAGASSPWFPAATDTVTAGKVAGWFSYCAGEVNTSLLYVRVATLFGWDIPVTLAQAQDKSKAVLAFLDAHLAAAGTRGEAWVASKEHPTLADIAVFPYVALTEASSKGALSLEPYPAVKAWVGRVKALPGYPPMDGA